ncbi:Glycosyl transferase family 2 [Nocardioides alpinus]|uniref:Glycosyl transferase family 2 n=1 Tax=Nocardioides alpinus TaxID=748909 RepID=A0A1I0XJH6_9ACTN|nr:glycosyltransferase family 2 protein [Nocardioides alpinus]PKH44352.1 glycosyltransferase family 2 protein [Nocardioides alpinus]SFB00378.1 Glycosyl transferase family 2 [Nocardioides alpinus]
MSGDRVLIIVPAWNEQDAIAGTIAEIRECVPDADLLVIDDGSRDFTVDRARAAGATVCPLPFNLGVGGAMRTGYRYALRHGYDVAVQIDADGQHDPRYLAALLAGLDHADVVIGARFATPDDPYKVRGPRRWAMVLLATVLSRLAHTRLTDVTSGFRVSNRRAIAVFATHYPAEYLGDTVESLVIAARAGCTITQVPVTMRARMAGTASHSPFKAAVYLCRAVVALILALVRDWPAQLEDVAPGDDPAVVPAPAPGPEAEPTHEQEVRG